MKGLVNHMLTGLIAGLLTPVFAFFLYVLFYRPGETAMMVLDRFNLRNVLTHVISLSTIPNLLVFFLFLWAGKERAAHGVIGATIIYALLVAGLMVI